MSRPRSRRRSNRSAKIITTAFSLVIVISFVLSLVGPNAFRRSADPTPFPTREFPTITPSPSPAPIASATPTGGVPTPVIVIPTTAP